MKRREKKHYTVKITRFCYTLRWILYAKEGLLLIFPLFFHVCFSLSPTAFCVMSNVRLFPIATADSHHDHFQTTLRSLPHVFFYFWKWRFFSPFSKNTRQHVAYSNRFRPKTMFKATSTSFINYLARKKETGSRTITCFKRKLDSWKFIWAIRKFLIRNKNTGKY